MIKVIDEINSMRSDIATSVEEQTATTSEISTNIAQAAQGIGEANENVAQSTVAIATITRDIANINQQAIQVGIGSNQQIETNALGLTSLASQLDSPVKQF